MKHSRTVTIAVLLGVLSLPFAMAQRKDEIRDFPPDFHQYIREALPEDMIPGGELALPSQILGIGGLANGILIGDVVISIRTRISRIPTGRATANLASP